MEGTDDRRYGRTGDPKETSAVAAAADGAQTDLLGVRPWRPSDTGMKGWSPVISSTPEEVCPEDMYLPKKVREGIARLEAEGMGACGLTVSRVFPKQTVSKSAVAVVGIGGLEAIAKIAKVPPSPQTDARRAAAAAGDEEDGLPSPAAPLQYERRIMKAFPNQFIRFRLSPNFVPYYGTLFCTTDSFVDRLREQEDTDPAELRELERQLAQFDGVPSRRPSESSSSGPSVYCALIMEKVPEFESLRDMSFRSPEVWNDATRASVAFQIATAAHTMEFADLINFDMHDRNVAIQRDVSGTPFAGGKPMIYVLPPLPASTPDFVRGTDLRPAKRGGPVIVEVPVQGHMVKMFDWDQAFATPLGRNTLLDERGMLCEKLGRCNIATENWRQILLAFRSAMPDFLALGQDRCDVEFKRQLRHFLNARSFNGRDNVYGRHTGRLNSSQKQFLETHKPFWNTLLIAHYLVATDRLRRLSDFPEPEEGETRDNFENRVYFSPFIPWGERQAMFPCSSAAADAEKSFLADDD